LKTIKQLKNTVFAVFFSSTWLQLGYSRDRAKALQAPFALYQKILCQARVIYDKI